MIDVHAPLTGTAAGVPFVVRPPEGDRKDAPVVVAWHLMDPPRTEAALAAALPLDGLDAWRIYLGLPLSGARMPDGGPDEVMQLGFEDVVMKLYWPITEQAAAEFPAALAELRDRFGFGDGPVAFVGGSQGAAVAQLALLQEGGPDVTAMVLVSPVTRLRPLVEANGPRFGFTYRWHEASLAAAGALDFVARAEETAQRQPAVRLVVGADDDESAIRGPAQQLREALAQRYADPERVDLVTVPDMGHALAEEPGLEPAPQLPCAATVDALAVEWLRRHLDGAAG